MKNYITLLLFLIGSIGIANAQYSDRRGGSTLNKYISAYTDLDFYSTEFPADATGKFKFNVGMDATFPLIENLSIVWGYGWTISLFTYESESQFDLTTYGMSLYGLAGYQMEALDWLTAQALIKTGPSTAIVRLDGVDQDNEIDLFGAFNINLLIFFNDMQTSGLKLGTDIGFSGGVNSLIGFVQTF